MILAKAPRRFGKSVAVSRIVISFALKMPGSTQSIFSTGRRASRNLLELCYKKLCDIGFQDREVRFNQEELFIQDPLSGKISKIFCYPSNSKICQGIRVHYIIISFLFFSSPHHTHTHMERGEKKSLWPLYIDMHDTTVCILSYFECVSSALILYIWNISKKRSFVLLGQFTASKDWHKMCSIVFSSVLITAPSRMFFYIIISARITTVIHQ